MCFDRKQSESKAAFAEFFMATLVLCFVFSPQVLTVTWKTMLWIQVNPSFIAELHARGAPLLRKIDLIHDIRHLCTRIRTDEINVMSRGFSVCKQAIKSAK